MPGKALWSASESEPAHSSLSKGVDHSGFSCFKPHRDAIQEDYLRAQLVRGHRGTNSPQGDPSISHMGNVLVESTGVSGSSRRAASKGFQPMVACNSGNCTATAAVHHVAVTRKMREM